LLLYGFPALEKVSALITGRSVMKNESWEEAVKEDELKMNVPYSAKVGKKTVVLVRASDGIHALGGKCPHHGAPLSEGVLLEHILTCPWHNARFDIISGKMDSPPALSDVAHYEVKVEKGMVYVRKALVEASVQISQDEQNIVGRSTSGKRDTIVIVGGGAAGNTAAITLKREGFPGRIILLTAEAELPYDRPNLSKDFLTGEAKREWIPLETEEFYQQLGIEIFLNHKVVDIDIREKTLTFAHESRLSYDKLLVATGGIPRSPAITGVDVPGFYLLRSFYDAEMILAALDNVEHVAVIGASFIGLEVAASLRTRNLDVHVIAPELVPMERIFGARVGNYIKKLCEDGGVHMHLGVTPEEIFGDGKIREVLLSDESKVPAEIVIAGIGVVPAVTFLEETGLVRNGAVTVNGRLQTDNEDIFAAGDIAVVPDPFTGSGRRIEHWVEAERQGQHAARTMMGLESDYRQVPFFWTKMFDTVIQYVGYSHTPEKIVYRGKVEEGNFLSGYYEKGKLKAVAGVGRPKDIIISSEIIKSGYNVSSQYFQDEGKDLRELFLKNSL
jgi:NADPH-dependent 2,4-dienoyl-CoA reductase/sulfur reductase-like enzyme/nitrite reductase/ring-hydroxylating ferredoxin subunit